MVARKPENVSNSRNDNSRSQLRAGFEQFEIMGLPMANTFGGRTGCVLFCSRAEACFGIQTSFARHSLPVPTDKGVRYGLERSADGFVLSICETINEG